MFAKKFVVATLSLGLVCGGASLVHAGGEPVSLVAIASDNYTQMCKDPDLRHCCLVLISGSDDVSTLCKFEDYMLKNPENFKHDLIAKMSHDEKFKENYLKFLEGCARYSKRYEEFMNKRPEALRWPPTW